MTDQLFRQEAIDHQNRRLAGEIMIVQPRSYGVLTIVMVSLVIGAIIFLCLSSYVRKETVFGKLTPSKGLIRLIADEMVTVDSVLVRESDIVEQGAVLFTVRRDNRSISKAATLLADLNVERAEILRRLDLLREKYNSEQASTENAIATLEAQQKQLDRQIQVQLQRVRLAEEQFRTIQTLLAENAASRLEAEDARERLLVQQQSLEDLRQRHVGVSGEISSAQIRLSALPADEESDRSRLREALSVLSQRRTEIEKGLQYEVRAPVAGRVAALQVRPGQVLRPGELQVAILPEGGQLVAEVFVPTRAAGFIAPGQNVRILYDAFPYQRFGAAEGVVRQVSKTILLPGEDISALHAKEPVYRMFIEIDKQEIITNAQTLPLQDGMTLRADIFLDRRSLAEWLLEPVLSFSKR